MNKGFTLVELLAVLIVLGILMTIVTTTILNQVDESKNKLNDAQIEIVKNASIEYANNKGLFKKSNSSYNICLNDLKNEGLIDDVIINSLNKDYYIKLTVKCESICLFEASDLLEYQNNIICN